MILYSDTTTSHIQTWNKKFNKHFAN